jgi:exopolysaccharide biosynthesis polyprenyl glycosylphosphotransferase
MERSTVKISPIQSRIGMDTMTREQVTTASRMIPIRWQWRGFILSLIVSDVLMIGLAFLLAYWVRFEANIPLFRLEVVPTLSFYQIMVAVMIPLWILVFGLMGAYNRQFLLGGTQEYSLIFSSSIVGMLIIISAGFIGNNLIFARGWVLLAWGFSFIAAIFGRFWLRRIVYYLRHKGYFLTMAVIVGANNEGISLAEQLMRWNYSGLHIVGFVDKKIPKDKPVYGDLKVLGSVEDIDRIIDENHVEEIILASSAITSRDKLVEIFMRYGMNTSRNMSVRMSSGLYEILTTGLTVKEFAYVPLVGVNPARLTGIDRAFKALLDYTLTIPLLILISPVLLVIAIAIKLDSPGPVIHRRRVMGMNGTQFDAFKFRTMQVNGDEILNQYPELKRELEQNHKLKFDPRITRLGHLLRKTSLDELPQFFNVLRKEMSLVGPRMISPAETMKYDKLGVNLLTVRPGITGLWQVSGRSDVSYEERVRLDMYYIRNWSIWSDLRLLLETIPAVLRKRGAY